MGLVQTLLEFTTGSGYINATIQFTVGEDTTDNLVFEIEFNDIIVAGVLSELAQAGQPSNLINLVIPPFTKVKTTGTNFTGAQTERKSYCILTGIVYGEK